MAVDEGNESSDAYCSSDEEDLSCVDFHTEVDDNMNSVNANVERVVEDTKSIDPEFKVKQGITYLRHDPTQNWNKMKHVLRMRFDHPEQLKLCLANYEGKKELDEDKEHKQGRKKRFKVNKGKKELAEDKEHKQGRKKRFKVNKVTTRSRAKTGE
nr:calcium/proton exchanger [Tanacetum cinerariifolium]